MSVADDAGRRPVGTGPAGAGSAGAGGAGSLRAAGPGSAGSGRPLGPAAGRSASVLPGAPAPSGAPHRLSPAHSGAALRSRSSGGARRGWQDVEARLLSIVGRLTERDRQLCRLLDDHRVLTTAQVADVGFAGERRARMRLAELYALCVLDRFRPQAWGSPSPFHWVLGPLGAALVAAESGTDPADHTWRRSLAHDLATSQRLAHLVGVNGFFTGLLRSARTRPGSELVEWWSERRCAREWGEVVRPDGYGIWSEADATLPFLLEHDNGTERLERLAAKLPGYARLAAAAGHPNWVLFSFPSPGRERDARRVLAHHGVPVATCVRHAGSPPDAAIWLPVASGTARLRLAQLADVALPQA